MAFQEKKTTTVVLTINSVRICVKVVSFLTTSSFLTISVNYTRKLLAIYIHNTIKQTTNSIMTKMVAHKLQTQEINNSAVNIILAFSSNKSVYSFYKEPSI